MFVELSVLEFAIKDVLVLVLQVFVKLQQILVVLLDVLRLQLKPLQLRVEGQQQLLNHQQQRQLNLQQQPHQELVLVHLGQTRDVTLIIVIIKEMQDVVWVKW